MTNEEIAEKIVQAIRNGKARSVAEEEFIPDDFSPSEKDEIKCLVDKALNKQKKISTSKLYQNRNQIDDYDLGR